MKKILTMLTFIVVFALCAIGGQNFSLIEIHYEEYIVSIPFLFAVSFAMAMYVASILLDSLLSFIFSIGKMIDKYKAKRGTDKLYQAMLYFFLREWELALPYISIARSGINHKAKDCLLLIELEVLHNLKEYWNVLEIIDNNIGKNHYKVALMQHSINAYIGLKEYSTALEKLKGLKSVLGTNNNFILRSEIDIYHYLCMYKEIIYIDYNCPFLKYMIKDGNVYPKLIAAIEKIVETSAELKDFSKIEEIVLCFMQPEHLGDNVDLCILYIEAMYKLGKFNKIELFVNEAYRRLNNIMIMVCFYCHALGNSNDDIDKKRSILYTKVNLCSAHVRVFEEVFFCQDAISAQQKCAYFKEMLASSNDMLTYRNICKYIIQ